MATSVVVNAPFQVFYDGQVYTPGQTAEVPDATAKQWQAHGWVEPKAPAKKRPGQPPATGR